MPTLYFLFRTLVRVGGDPFAVSLHARFNLDSRLRGNDVQGRYEEQQRAHSGIKFFEFERLLCSNQLSRTYLQINRRDLLKDDTKCRNCFKTHTLSSKIV